MIRLSIAAIIAVVFLNAQAFENYMVSEALRSCPEALVECD